jgi:hypothetical protein
LIWINPRIGRISDIVATAEISVFRKGCSMSDKEKAEKDQAQRLRDAFEGLQGRRPTTDRELSGWPRRKAKPQQRLNPPLCLAGAKDGPDIGCGRIAD